MGGLKSRRATNLAMAILCTLRAALPIRVYSAIMANVYVPPQLTNDDQFLHGRRQPSDPPPGVLLAVLAVDELGLHSS